MVLLLLLRWKKEKKRCNKWHSCFFEKFEKYKDVEKNQHKCFPEIIFTSKKIAGIVLFFLPRKQQQQQHLCKQKKTKQPTNHLAHTCRNIILNSTRHPSTTIQNSIPTDGATRGYTIPRALCCPLVYKGNYFFKNESGVGVPLMKCCPSSSI